MSTNIKRRKYVFYIQYILCQILLSEEVEYYTANYQEKYKPSQVTQYSLKFLKSRYKIFLKCRFLAFLTHEAIKHSIKFGSVIRSVLHSKVID